MLNPGFLSASVMNMDERAQVIKTAVEEVKGKIPILCGTGTIDPLRVKEQTLQAMDLGCDASLIVTPYYVKVSRTCWYASGRKHSVIPLKDHHCELTLLFHKASSTWTHQPFRYYGRHGFACGHVQYSRTYKG